MNASAVRAMRLSGSAECSDLSRDGDDSRRPGPDCFNRLVELGISVAVIETGLAVVGARVFGLWPTPWIDFIGSNNVPHQW